MLSSQPQFVSGGSALIEVAPPEGVALSRVKVALNGTDVTARFSTTDAAAGSLRGLVDGLTTNPASATGSANTLVVSNLDKPDQQTSLELVNYPITGPILSGPHLTPYDCRTVQNGLGAALDADCTATTTLNYFYRTTANAFKPLPNPTGARPADLASDHHQRRHRRALHRAGRRPARSTAASIASPCSMTRSPALLPTGPAPAGTESLVAYFDCCGSAQYNQGVQPAGMVLDDRELRRGFAVMISTELFEQPARQSAPAGRDADDAEGALHRALRRCRNGRSAWAARAAPSSST